MKAAAAKVYFRLSTAAVRLTETLFYNERLTENHFDTTTSYHPVSMSSWSAVAMTPVRNEDNLITHFFIAVRDYVIIIEF
jgi:hypothetical protein